MAITRGIFGLAVAASALIASAAGQFVSPPTDLTEKVGYAGVHVRYKQVPNGICELDPKVKSFSGYTDVAKDQHHFFWFFEARDVDPQDAPLTVWINGGPGSSSMIGLLSELGPCYVDVNGKPYNNPYSWNTVSNMLFIDQPTQTGFSYSKPVPGVIDPVTLQVTVLPNNKCPSNDTGNCGTWSLPSAADTANTTDNAAPFFWKTLQGFMGAFPQYSRNSFHFATESYGGHYGPIFNEYIEEQNAHLPQGAVPIKLETIMIGNGWYDPQVQYAAYYNFTVSPGNTYDFRPFNKSFEELMYKNEFGPGGCYEQNGRCNQHGTDETCANADTFCANNVEGLLDELNRDEYDIRELNPDNFPYSFFIDYLNTEKVQKAIGAYTNFSESNGEVGNTFGATGDDDKEEMTIEDCQKLIADGLYLVQYAGDADYNCNWLGGQVVAEMIDAPGFSRAGFANISTPDHVVHGQAKQADNFAFLRVYYSGHEVPFYQPLLALTIFNRTIHGLDIETGTRKVAKGGNYLTTGPKVSTFREGNATVQFKVLPDTATYNTTTGAPNPPN